ncbi:aspartoacylase [Tychonema sp. LEGE 07199]|uniref:aspartoacylase n=1 Tax=unclassified Tychonema TaxID=2642144 RepID=UPI001882EA3F|nr:MULTISPECIES: aspartoacylase [unclassified Tychonema]MBE9122990.1 aspartoacylase [Tychonema sp. LEGE 07199]MBE9133633.1 aspartoacylase [Tychonema sp. LEGE 07196]
MNPIKRVAIVGGTHGNELTGIYLVKKFDRAPQSIGRSTFETIALLANPKASEIGRRYVDIDLNRCFRQQDLQNPHLSTYEAQRAKEIYHIFSSKTTPQQSLIIDLHSTTSNMGLTFILASQHPFNLQLAAYLTSVYPHLKLLVSATNNYDSPLLRSISQLGGTLEVGAVPQGVLDASLFQQTEQVVGTILDCVESYNQGTMPAATNPLTVYHTIGAIDYPRSEKGEIQAMIHPQLQSRDYQALNPGDPMFLTFEGESVFYEGKSTVYPIFINEAAYYEKGIAMCFTQKQIVSC